MIVTPEQAAQMAGEAIARGEVFIAYPMGWGRGYSVYTAQAEGSQYVPDPLTVQCYRGPTLVAIPSEG